MLSCEPANGPGVVPASPAQQADLKEPCPPKTAQVTSLVKLSVQTRCLRPYMMAVLAPTCWFSPWKSRFTSLYLWAYVPLWGAHMLVFPIKITLYVPLPLGFLWAYVPLWGAYTGKTDCSPNSISESSQARLRSKPSEALSELFQRTCQGCHAVEI